MDPQGIFSARQADIPAGQQDQVAEGTDRSRAGVNISISNGTAGLQTHVAARLDVIDLKITGSLQGDAIGGINSKVAGRLDIHIVPELQGDIFHHELVEYQVTVNQVDGTRIVRGIIGLAALIKGQPFPQKFVAVVLLSQINRGLVPLVPVKAVLVCTELNQYSGYIMNHRSNQW